jgi:L-alanine-DL-glutamate epimerase-like enolase superfamily enzyme
MIGIASLEFSPLDVSLLAPFGIATGAQHIAHNVLVSLRTEQGTIGYGEGAPVEHISGETQHAVLAALNDVAELLRGANLCAYRPLCLQLREALGHVPSALQAVEIAIFDALTKYYGTSLLNWFGAAETELFTDTPARIAVDEGRSGRRNGLRHEQRNWAIRLQPQRNPPRSARGNGEMEVGLPGACEHW